VLLLLPYQAQDWPSHQHILQCSEVTLVDG